MKQHRILPALTLTEFTDRLLEATDPQEIDPICARSLFVHYNKLRRWNPKISLVGKGTIQKFFQRHYGESLAALQLIHIKKAKVMDIGSGAGFPGLPIAASRPNWSITLLEASKKKSVFLESVRHAGRFTYVCLNLRLEDAIHLDEFRRADIFTCRGLVLNRTDIAKLLIQSPKSRLLLWAGKQNPSLERPVEIRREVQLAGSTNRRILEIHLAAAG